MNGSERVKLSKVVEKMQLENMTPQIDISGTWLHIPEVNRPALQLTGFYNQFDNDRLQIIGNVEYSYLKSLSETERYERYAAAFKQYSVSGILPRIRAGTENFRACGEMPDTDF